MTDMPRATTRMQLAHHVVEVVAPFAAVGPSWGRYETRSHALDALSLDDAATI